MYIHTYTYIHICKLLRACIACHVAVLLWTDFSCLGKILDNLVFMYVYVCKERSLAWDLISFCDVGPTQPS